MTKPILEDITRIITIGPYETSEEVEGYIEARNNDAILEDEELGQCVVKKVTQLPNKIWPISTLVFEVTLTRLKFI